MQYVITATVTERTAEGARTTQVPTFYLDADVQGIIDARHAEQVAIDVIDPFNRFDVHAYAEEHRPLLRTVEETLDSAARDTSLPVTVRSDLGAASSYVRSARFGVEAVR